MEGVLSGKSVNLKTLSHSLGLSQTTVSRALNGFPEVNEETRKRVLSAASQLNYRPSPSASTLATGKAWAIGHVVPLADHRMINPHFADFIEGASEVYAQCNYEMLIRSVPASKEEEAYNDLASRNRVDGVVVHGPLCEDPRISQLKKLGMPFVVHGRSDGEDQSYSWLDVNNRSAFQRATEFLLDLGHRRIALLNGLETMNFAKRRREGFEQAMRERDVPVDNALIYARDMVEPYGYNAAKEILARNNRPTAILTSSILVAMGASRAIADNGLTIGRDISVLAFDDRLSFLQSENHLNQTPYFTSMQSSIREAGKRVAQILTDQINGKETLVQELWEAQLVIGRSTGPCRD